MKPKNYSRKVYICTCTTIIFFDNKKLDEIKVKYEVEPNKSKKNFNNKNYKWYTPPYWGTYKKIVELPEYFNKMEEQNDYVIKTSTFLRDGVSMPYVSAIFINNKEKYESLKLQENRKSKLNNFLNN